MAEQRRHVLKGDRSQLWALMERFVIPNLDDPPEIFRRITEARDLLEAHRG